MSLILDRISPRFDIWEEQEPVARPQLVQGMGDAVQGMVDLALMVASPLILLTDWLSSIRQPENAPPDWTYGGVVGEWKVWSQTWLHSDDFPEGLDYYADPQEVYALLRFRFSPEIADWEQRYFFEESLLCPEGLYMLSYEPTGKGMALHLLPTEGGESEVLAILASHEWELSGQEEGGLLLEAPLETGLGQVFIARRF